MGDGVLSIKLRCASWQQLATIYKRDLSHGTMFLRAPTPPEIGTAVRIDLAPFTLVGATTRSGLLTTPLRERFGIPLRMNFYSPAELELIVRRGSHRPRPRPLPFSAS